MIQSEMKRDKIELIKKRERVNIIRKARERKVSPIGYHLFEKEGMKKTSRVDRGFKGNRKRKRKAEAI